MAIADSKDMLRRLQDIREHVYRIQEKASSITPLGLFEELRTLVALCDEAIDFDIQQASKP